MDAFAREIAESLITRFAWRVDRDGGRGIGALFTANARLILPVGGADWRQQATLEGRDAIAHRWADRPANRITRHLHLNLDILEQSAHRVVCRSVGVGYRHDGDDWGEPRPVIIADYDDVCVRDIDGEWRFLERCVTPVFIAPELR